MSKRSPKSRLTGLILIPVVLLAGIAGFGLVEYRHSITADAREATHSWTGRSASLYERFIAETDAQQAVRFYRDIPAIAESESPDVAKLKTEDIEVLRSLRSSTGHTASGVPVRVLAAWRLVDLTSNRADAERLVQIAIHEAPSPISQPILTSLNKRFPDGDAWQDEWQASEARRELLARHTGATGFVPGGDGPAFVNDGKALTSQEVRGIAEKLHAGVRREFPPWMELDLVALDQSLIVPVARPFAAGGSPLEVVIGIGDPSALYAGYWQLVIWATALILFALVTAIIGIWLVQRTLERERRLGELKSQFVASVSHELRTPVASMRLMADALDSGKVTGTAAKDFHRLMSQEGARLSSLIENVLDFARIEEGKKEYNFEEADLSALVQDTLHLMEPVAAQRKITLVGELPEIVRTRIDRAAIQQALINLIDNAIKFSPRRGEIEINLATLETGWELSVSDKGPGIPLPDRRRVFERFTRLGNELRRETQGTGIGLSIVQHIVEAHGATIAIDGSAGGGCKFVIRSEGRGDRQSVPAQEATTPDLAPEPCDS